MTAPSYCPNMKEQHSSSPPSWRTSSGDDRRTITRALHESTDGLALQSKKDQILRHCSLLALVAERIRTQGVNGSRFVNPRATHTRVGASRLSIDKKLFMRPSHFPW